MGTRIKIQRAASSEHYPNKASYRVRLLRVHKNLLNFCLTETQHGGDNGRPGRSCWGEDGEADSLSPRQTAKEDWEIDATLGRSQDYKT